MSTFQVYPLHKVLLRRTGAVSLGILAFPFILPGSRPLLELSVPCVVQDKR